MASSGAPSSASASTPRPEAAAKKARKNPARRKAEKTNTDGNAPKDPPPSTKNESTVPAMLSRQASAPSVVGIVNSIRPPLKNRKSTTAAGTPKAGAVDTPLPKGTATQPKASAVTLANNISRPTPRRSASTPATFNAPALVTGGLIGCVAGAAILMAVHVWYDFAGLKAAVATARAARLCVDNLSEELIASLNAGTYSTNEALDMLRRTTLAYASTIPDGAPAVERVFREIEAVRQSRGAEVDKVLAGAYEELRAAGEKGLSVRETRDVVLRHLLRLSLFASRATQDVLTRNPRLKPYRDGAIKALKEPPKEKVPTTKVNLVVKHKQGTPWKFSPDDNEPK